MERGSLPSLALKATIETALKANSFLNLKSAAFKAVTDFGARAPQMMAVAFKPENVVGSFVKAGFLDDETRSGPDYDGALATCRRPISKQEEDLCARTFPVIFKAMDDFGHVSDELFEELGFARDLNSRGEEVHRDATVSCENRQRAKVLSHAEQRKLRQQLKDDAAAAVAAKGATENAKRSVLISSNCTAETAIFAQMKKPPSSARNELGGATLEMVAKLNAAELRALVHVRLFDSSTVNWLLTPFKKWPNKGKPDDAEPNLISWAHGLRTADLVLVAEALAPAAAAAEPAPLAPLVVTAVTGMTAFAGDQPSVLLRNPTWVATLFSSLHGSSEDFVCSPTTADCARADLLVKLLLSRLETHKTTRVSDASKRKSWVFGEVVVPNLAAVAAAAVAYGHIKEDLEVATADTTLLSSREAAFVLACGDMAVAEGCYVHKDGDTGRFVRSGKVVGENRNFGLRNKEHAHCSLLLSASNLESRFYTSYPAKSTEVKTGAARRGFFGNLGQYVGLGFTRSNTEAVEALCTSDENGLLSWSASALTRVAAVNFPGSLTLKEKQLHMVGYLFELAYDLMISPRENVSRSPGFETPLGIFGGT
mmetsp:Transcript_43463/g.73934  ORF Transcript_43463/g.73934 Transcript_43463/m.73934 type:complete len:596 (-) Transcript_43463:239-2026(-)